jgi:hypothetical protein
VTCKSWWFGAGIIFMSAFIGVHVCRAQSFVRYTLDSWTEDDLAETFDHPIIELGGHVTNAPSDTQVFSWDSFGRVRFNRHDANSPFAAYRILTIDSGLDSGVIKSTMDEFDLALGLHLGEVRGWKAGAIFGAGYSSTHPFVHTSGIFGIGHVTFERPIGAIDSLVLSLDYEGNGGLLPDVPLPGFAWMHHGAKVDSMLGFPMSHVVWRVTDPLEITLQYTVPFTADVDVEYRLARHVGLYADAGNFFQGFVVAPSAGAGAGDITNRQFYQMRRVEMGMRLIFGKLVDASVGVGYAFDQQFSRGLDVRDLRSVGQLSNEPYLAVVLRGRF